MRPMDGRIKVLLVERCPYYRGHIIVQAPTLQVKHVLIMSLKGFQIIQWIKHLTDLYAVGDKAKILILQ